MKKERYGTIFSMVINFVVITAKIFGGLIFSSYALLCSAYCTMCDLFEEFLAFIGSKVRGRRVVKKEPFGVSKFAYISQILVGFIFVTIGIFIFLKSLTLNYGPPNFYIIYIIITIILLKFLSANYLFSKGKKIQSEMLISSAHSSFYDARLNVIVLFIIILSMFFSVVDFVGCLLLSGLILFKGVKKIIENIIIINGKNNKVTKIIDKIKKITNNCSNINLVSIDLTNYRNFYIITIEIEVDNISLSDVIQIENLIRKKLYHEKLKILMISFSVY